MVRVLPSLGGVLAYRDAVQEVTGKETLQTLGRLARRLGGHREWALEALIIAGQLECALADLRHESLPFAMALTDGSAAALIAERVPQRALLDALERIRAPDRLQLRIPEGYAYYGLDPRSYGALAEGYGEPLVFAAVIGVRSVGTSLGAVTSRAFQGRGVSSDRITVRPTGHPWDRTMTFAGPERRFVTALRDRGATFFVVDEGPGQSGTTFLAVAEALEREGIGVDRIVLFGSHVPNVSLFVGRNAHQRFARFRFFSSEPMRAPPGWSDLSAGSWRRQLFDTEQAWPACWIQAERIKYRSEDGRWLAKFEGLPPHGKRPLERARCLSAAGFSPELVSISSGLAIYSWIDGRPALRNDLTTAAILRIAAYCAFRVQNFGATTASTAELDRMVRVNVTESLGPLPARLERLDLRVPVIVDGRMMPHEWIVTPEGVLMKADAVDHGDDHFLPGPTDIAWDLAGAAIEWQMNAGTRELLASTFERMTGDPVRKRLPGFLVAYAAFRIGMLSMASLGASPDEQRRIQASICVCRTEIESHCYSQT